VKFKGDFLNDMLDDGNKDVIAEDRVIDHDRWSVTHKTIFKHDGLFYSVFWMAPATEYQDVSRFGTDDDIECDEVVPVETTVTIYQKK
jgi:hypothetical protein